MSVELFHNLQSYFLSGQPIQQLRRLCLCTASSSAVIAAATPARHFTLLPSQYRPRALATVLHQQCLRAVGEHSLLQNGCNVCQEKKAIKSSKNKNILKTYSVRAVLILAYPPGIGSYITILSFIILTFVVML